MNGDVLTITRVKAADEGAYGCFLTNGFDSNPKVTNYDVKVKSKAKFSFSIVRVQCIQAERREKRPK